MLPLCTKYIDFLYRTDYNNFTPCPGTKTKCITERRAIMKHRTLLKALAVLLSVSMLVPFSVYAEGASDVNMDEETVTIAIPFDPATMEPWATMGDGRIDVIRHVYEYMFDYEKIGGDLLPCIASGYEQTDDVTYRVTIYDNITDSAGNHITAEDVVFSYETTIEIGNQGIGVNTIDHMDVIDDTTIDFVFNTTAAGAFANAMTNTAIVSKAAYEADPEHFASKPVGTGHYVLDEFTPGSTISFSKREDYWQSEEECARLSEANIGHVVYKVIPEASQLTIALESGDVDIAYYILSSDIHRFEDVEGFHLEARPKDLAEVILYNCDPSNVFADEKLRQAVSYAIASEAVLQTVYDGAGGVCKTYGSPLFADYNEKWNEEDYYDYNPEKAKELLAEAGYADGLKVRLMTDNGAIHTRMAQVIQSMLSEVGIEVEILAYDGNLINTYRFDPTQFDFYIASKSSFDYITSVWKFSFDQVAYKGMTLNFYVDPELQTLLETALDSATHTEENIDKFHYALKDLALGYGICYGTNYLAYNDKIEELAIDFKTRVVGGACIFNPDKF